MGLDISAYRQLTPAPADWFDDEGEPLREHWDDSVRIYRNPDFPGRDAGLSETDRYTFADKMGFRAGSYGGYSEWRNWLAKLAAYPVVTDEPACHQHSAGAWRASGGPFWEMIDFSDCEGVIGPIVAAKLAADFAAFDDAAKAADPDDWFYDRYKLWCQAFEMAADGGAVEFH
jgi:hypothetical protein